MGRLLQVISAIGASAVWMTPPAALAAPGPSASIVGSRLPPIETATLDNGLQIAVLRIDAAPVVAVQVWYHAGSKDEPRDRRGVAHMFEHMMFQGTVHLAPESHGQLVTALGGYVNATTEEDETHYIDTLPAEDLDFALRLEAERMRGLLLRPDMINAERDLVKDEIRQRETSPIAKGFLRFLGIAFTKHPYAWTAGGTAADLDATTPEDLRKFYDAYYQPNNAMLIVVGKTTLAAVKASAQKYFGAIPKAAVPPRPSASAVEPEQTAKRREVVDPGQIGIAMVGWHIPPAKHPDIYALQLATLLLGNGESSRLKVRLKSPDPKTKHPIALEGAMEAVVREEPGMVVALGAYADPANGDAVEAAIVDEITKLGATGPRPDELRKVKNQVESGFVFSLENAQGLAEAIGHSWILTGDPTLFLRDVDAFDKVSAADVMRVVKTYLKPDRATVVVIPPRGK